MLTKRCSDCKEDKALDLFTKNKSTKDGLHNHCRACHSANSRYQYQTTPEVRKRIQIYQQEWRRSNPERYMLNNTRNRAKRNGIPFNLTIEDCFIPEICPVLGIPLVSGQVRTTGMIADNSPTLDRIDPTLGYIKGNVRVISWRANHIKNNATLKELEAIIEYIKSHKEVCV